MDTAQANWTASTVVTGHLVASLRGRVEFRSADHELMMKDGRAEIRRRNVAAAEERLKGELSRLPTKKMRRKICRAKKTGAWLTV